ncbi:hypothetical protein BC826DRAFT_360776 [Russula brevipes]|nr:hypothetical protein BC826DRAFT_360776 [Russula brevipes]
MRALSFLLASLLVLGHFLSPSFALPFAPGGLGERFCSFWACREGVGEPIPTWTPTPVISRPSPTPSASPPADPQVGAALNGTVLDSSPVVSAGSGSNYANAGVPFASHNALLGAILTCLLATVFAL